MTVEPQTERRDLPLGNDPVVPLAVDLDGTLIRSDVLLESFLGLLKQAPLSVLLVPLWLLGGKAHLKDQIARRVDLDVTVLPYRAEFLAYLEEEHTHGRKLVLATATHRKYADQIAAHLHLFDEVIATDGTVNISGTNKLERLISRFGEDGFDYAANGRVDLDIWPHARRALLVSPEAGVRGAIPDQAKIERVFPDADVRITDYFQAIRLHQWVKNVLVFVPLLASHQGENLVLLFQCLVAFVAFGLAASSAYILNDLLDLTADRRHPRKRNRPIPAARVPIVHALWIVAALLAGAVAAGLAPPPLFLVCLSRYYLCTTPSSVKLKNFAILDVCVLAGLYTLRIIAGAAAIENQPTFWLLAFSVFLFLSLALVKRYSELMVVADQHREQASGRGYRVGDLTVLQA